jgi:DNA-binding MarR family transcriptional regulator
LIERIACEADRRSCQVTLTPEGITLLDAALAAHIANMGQILTGLSTQEKTNWLIC